MTESDISVPPQQDIIGLPRRRWWFQRAWDRLKLWWALRKARKVIKVAIAEAKARPPQAFDGPPNDHWRTGPPPEIPPLTPTLANAFEDSAADPRHTIVKPKIGDPIDVDTSKSGWALKGYKHA